MGLFRKKPRGRPDYHNESVVQRIVSEEGVDRQTAKHWFDEMLVFLDLCATSKRVLSPPEPVDKAWHAFLLHLCDALGGSAANFISHDLASSQAAVSVTARTDPQALIEYGKHWHQVDPWAHSPLSAQLRTESVVAGDRLIGRDDMRRTAFYNDFGQRHDIFQCLVGMIEVSPRALSCLSMFSR